MKHYMYDNEVYGFPEDGSQDHLIPVDAVLVEKEVLEAYLKNRITPEERLASLPPVSHAQIVAALISTGILSEDEGVAWVTGTLPPSVEAVIASLPKDQRTIARLRAIRPSSVVPTDPLVSALASAEGKTTEDLVDIFSLAASL